MWNYHLEEMKFHINCGGRWVVCRRPRWPLPFTPTYHPHEVKVCVSVWKEGQNEATVCYYLTGFLVADFPAVEIYRIFSSVFRSNALPVVASVGMMLHTCS